MSDAPRCPRCDQPLERRPRGAGDVTHGAVAVLLEGADVWVCPEGHHRQERSPELLPRLLAAVDHDLVVSERTRMRKRLRCGVCGAELTIPGRRTTRSVSATVPGTGVVRATFDLPMLRCPDCGRDQVPHEVGRVDLPEALALAVAAGGAGGSGGAGGAPSGSGSA